MFWLSFCPLRRYRAPMHQPRMTTSAENTNGAVTPPVADSLPPYAAYAAPLSPTPCDLNKALLNPPKLTIADKVEIIALRHVSESLAAMNDSAFGVAALTKALNELGDAFGVESSRYQQCEERLFEGYVTAHIGRAAKQTLASLNPQGTTPVEFAVPPFSPGTRAKVFITLADAIEEIFDPEDKRYTLAWANAVQRRVDELRAEAGGLKTASPIREVVPKSVPSAGAEESVSFPRRETWEEANRRIYGGRCGFPTRQHQETWTEANRRIYGGRR